MELILFYIFAGLAVVAALGVVSFRNSLSSAFALVASLFAVACLFAMLQAHFLAAMQILVYAGAIMVLFIFVIMLLNLGREALLKIKLSFSGVVGILLGGYLAVLLVLKFGLLPEGAKVLSDGVLPDGVLPSATGEGYGTVREVGRLLFTDYLVPFEATSILLLVAIVGAVVLAKKNLVAPSRSEGGQ